MPSSCTCHALASFLSSVPPCAQGVVAMEPIEADEMVVEYVGEIIRLSVGDIRGHALRCWRRVECPTHATGLRTGGPTSCGVMISLFCFGIRAEARYEASGIGSSYLFRGLLLFVHTLSVVVCVTKATCLPVMFIAVGCRDIEFKCISGVH